MSDHEFPQIILRWAVAICFFPYAGCIWMRHCYVKRIGGIKQFLLLSCGGVVSWGLIIASFFLPKPFSRVSLINGCILYLALFCAFGYLTTKKYREIEEEKNNRQRLATP